MRSLWAAALLLRRIRAERGLILLAFVVVGATSFVFAAAPRLFNRASDDALHYAMEHAQPTQRNLVLALVSPASNDRLDGIRGFGDSLASDLPPALSALVADRKLQATAARFTVSDPPVEDTRLTLSYQDGLTDATRLVDGRWPVDRGTPLQRVEIGNGSTTGSQDQPPVVVEVALSTAEAARIGVRVGDRLTVTMDGEDPLLTGTRFDIVPAEVEVVGLYQPLDPAAEYWDADTSLIEATEGGTDLHPILFASAFMAPETHDTLRRSGMPFHYQWLLRIDPGRMDAGQVGELQAELRHLAAQMTTSELASPGSPVLRTGLLAILDAYAAQRALAGSVLSVAVLGPLALAGGALAMIAVLLITPRRSTLALARGRGATGALLLGAQLWEATLLAGGASLLGLLAAVTLVPARDTALSPALALGVGGGAILLLAGASWRVTRRPLGQVERGDPPVLRVAPRRLVIEITIVGVAAAGALLLRQRGVVIGAPGEPARFDPLLAAVPLLAGVAAGIIVMRLYPLPIRGLGWLAAQGRGLIPVLGLRTIGRHPASANLPLLVLMLTAAFGAFALVIGGSIDRGQIAASYHEVGADYRIERIGIGALDPALDPGTVPGVEAVAPGIIDPTAAFARTQPQLASVYLEAVDPDAYAQVTADTPADPHWPSAILAAPAEGAGTEASPIPAILSRRLPGGTGDLAVGGTFQITVLGQPMTFRLVEQRATFAGIGGGVAFAVVPFNWVQAAFENGPKPPPVEWLRAPASAAAALAARIGPLAVSTRLESRYAAYAGLHDQPLGAAVALGYGLALIVAAGYTALTIIGSLVLSTTGRTRDLAYLRTLGVTGRQALALTVVEHTPPVLLALLPGVALGIGLAYLLEPGLGLATFAGTSGGVPLFVDWPMLALLALSLIGVVALAVAAGTWLSRRVRVVDSLRIGDD